MMNRGRSASYGWKIGSGPWAIGRKRKRRTNDLRKWIEEQRRFNARITLAIILVAIISLFSIAARSDIGEGVPKALGVGVTLTTATTTTTLPLTITTVVTSTHTALSTHTTTVTRTLTTYTTSHIAHTYLKHDWIGGTPFTFALVAWALYGPQIASEYGLDKNQFFDRIRSNWAFLLEVSGKYRTRALSLHDIRAPYGQLIRSGIVLAPSDMYYSLLDEMYPEYLCKRLIRGIYTDAGGSCLDFYEQHQWRSNDGEYWYSDDVGTDWERLGIGLPTKGEGAAGLWFKLNPYHRLIDPAIYGPNPLVILIKEPGWTIEPGTGKIILGPHGTYPPKDQLQELGLPLSEMRGSRTFYLIIPRKYLREIGIPEELAGQGYVDPKTGRIFKDLAIARGLGWEGVGLKEEWDRFFALTKRAIEVLRRHEEEVGYPIGNWVLAPLDHWLPKEVCNVLPYPSPIFYRDEAELAKAMANWYRWFGQFVPDHRWERDKWFMQKWGIPNDQISQIEAARASPNVWYFLMPGNKMGKVVLQIPPGLEGRG
ncbi:MAG: hypothetical protein QXG32_00645 [Candidatus Bathyarchaeia archaeon]